MSAIQRRRPRRLLAAGALALARRAAQSEAVRRTARAQARAAVARARSVRARRRRGTVVVRRRPGPVMPLAGVIVGGISVYLLDPNQGAQRRAAVRDTTMRYARRAAGRVQATARHLRDRAYGLWARRRRPQDDTVADDARRAADAIHAA